MSKPILQAEFLDHIELQIEEQLKEAISVFQNLPEKILLQPGPDNGWSIAQCFDHLNSYAEFYLPRIAKSIGKARSSEADSVFHHTLLGRYFIQSMDPNLSKKKFKAMKKHRPVHVGDPHAVIAAFIGHLENLLVLSRKGRNKVLTTHISTSISSLLKINVGDALAFVLIHNRRHLNQAKRLLQA